jgi:hypothetical protein
VLAERRRHRGPSQDLAGVELSAATDLPAPTLDASGRVLVTDADDRGE